MFVVDDSDVDYDLMQAQSMSESGPSVPGGGGGGGEYIPPYLPPTIPIPGVPLLAIEVFDGAKIVSFNTIPGLVYRVEETANLSNPVWTTIEEFVATSSDSDFVAEDDAMRFYRVFQEDDIIQFPDWFDSIYQYMRFDVYTPVTDGTYAMELYADGNLVFTGANTIPPDGRFFVHDVNYNPADWPNRGYYGVGEWELRVTVTPAAGSGGGGGGAGTHRVVKKTGVQRNPFGTYKGMTVGQSGIFSTTTTAQDEVDQSLWFCMAAMYNACEIVDWNFSFVDVPATDSSHMSVHATLYNATQWDPLRQWVTRQTAANTLSGNTLDYFHYMGHGSPKGLGSVAGQMITLAQLRGSPFLKTDFLTYAALDGCRTMKSTKLITALVGYGETTSRLDIAQKGGDPHFGCGWDDVKQVGWVLQGIKNDNHFYFWEDFYFHLTHRNQVTGLMDRTYEQAYAFARNPMGEGVNHTLQSNAEANGFKMVGCLNCYFDERPRIVQ
ncbi:MAG: hypothetical protein L0Y58_03265 [Verrucomicrobia subdivision 3 bacterium]|nr:hypothetical protein [Limisphaerales bacterium]